MSDFRLGLGVDAHAFADGAPLVLGGVRFEHPRGLAGHSDGDVITHALVDALLAAVNGGDIGTLFPSDDPSLEGISSLDMLREAYARVVEQGYELVNASCVLIGEEPRIASRRGTMASALAEAIGVDAGVISVAATTTDRLGFTGRGEGLAAEAVALLARVGVRPAPGA